ncbi:MAG: hypothetical protein C5B54_10550 [Acidobacteria bacterium]|nr:MAG: hypothetical protein C5B54_10550 [Acidobacteriota bacterium]
MSQRNSNLRKNRRIENHSRRVEMKLIRITVMGLLAMALFMTCSAVFAQDVNADYDKAYDFSKLKTFNMKIGTSWGNPITEKRVIDEFTSALTKKGWTATDEASADAEVVIHGATQQKHDVNTFYSGYGGWGYYGWGGGMTSAHTTVSQYTVGTLVCDIFDAKAKQLVFRGTASDEVSDKPEKNAKKITKAAEKMFKKFPPGSEKKK